jgi:integrase
MAKMKLMPIGNGLEIERAISPAERRRILDAADTLPVVGGRSKDRHRFRDKVRPMRKGYRPFRNRAIVYTLIETGMRRAAGRNIDLADVDFEKRLINVEEKGGRTHGYKISREGISAIEDYVAKERADDFKKWKSPALFLSPATNAHGDGRLNPRVINTVFNEACSLAGVEGHTPHDAATPCVGTSLRKPAISRRFKGSLAILTQRIPKAALFLSSCLSWRRSTLIRPQSQR